MTELLLRRMASLAVVLLLVSFLVSGLVHLVPGDPAIRLAGEDADPARIAEIRGELGLNDPLPVQYAAWLGSAVRGDLGSSLITGRSVTATVAGRVPVTLSLTAGALLVAIALGLPAGIIGAITRDRPADRAVTAVTSLAISVPNYWLGLMLLLGLAVYLPVFPALGYSPPSEGLWEWARHLVLPSIALGAVAGGEFARQLRTALVQTMDRPFMTAARAKGIRQRALVTKHALKLSMAPALTNLGLQASVLIGGSVIVETVFGIPGIGQLAIRAVVQGDLPIIQGIVVFTTLVVVTVNVLVDLSYAWLDPRVRAA